MLVCILTYIGVQYGFWEGTSARNSYCCCLVTESCLTLCDPMNCSTPRTVSRNFLKLASIKSGMPSNHLILCRLLLLLPSVFPRIRRKIPISHFSNETRTLALAIRWPKYCSFSFSISPSTEYSALISYKIDCWFPCSPRDSQESSPKPQFESVESSVLRLLCGPALTSMLLPPLLLSRFSRVRLCATP